MKCENCGSCLKHPLEEELQWDRADGSEGADLNSLNQTQFLSKKGPDFLSLGSAVKHVNGGACSVSLSVSLLLSECWTLPELRSLNQGVRGQLFTVARRRLKSISLSAEDSFI